MGIDPGSVRTGFGILETENDNLKIVHAGVIKTNPRHDFPRRLKAVYEQIASLIDSYHPVSMGIEDTFYAKNVKSALKLGQVKGVAMLAAVRKDLPVYEYSPLDVKKAVAGYGRAEKDQVKEMVQRILNLTEEPAFHDTSDALAVAICHAHSMKFTLMKEKDTGD